MDAPDADNGPQTVVYTGTRAPSHPPGNLRLVHRPLLEVVPLNVNLERLEFLTDDATGIVVYSRNAVRSLRKNGAHRTLAPFDRHVWWAVGKKTAGVLHREFGVRARYPKDQCFEGLQLELEDADLPDRVVAFSLEGRDRDLTPVLEERGIEFHDIPVYRTEFAEYDGPAQLVADGDWLVLTSSKGVRALFDVRDDPDAIVRDLQEIRVATIGPKTAATAEEFGLPVDFVPPAPDRDGLLAELASPRDERA